MDDQSLPNQKLIKILRSIVNSTSKKLNETVKWGNGCWVKDDLPIVYIYADKKQLQLGFFAGALMTDPKDFLQGSGKFVRHVKIKSNEDIDKVYFSKLIKQAIKIKYK